jgi:hypothetical protein
MALSAKRISLECPVIRPEVLKQHIQSATESVDFTFNAVEEYHLTVLYIGRPAEIFEVVSSARLEYAHRPLTALQFIVQLRKWLNSHATTLRHSVHVSTKEVITLGSSSPYTIACLMNDLPPSLLDLHGALVRSFEEFLESALGVPSGPGLLRNSEVFGFSGKSWIPHITVGQCRKPLSIAIPAVTIEIGPLQIRNIGSLNES